MNRKLLILIGALVVVGTVDALSLLYVWHQNLFAVKWLFRILNFGIYVFLIGMLLKAADLKGKLVQSREDAQRTLREAEAAKAQADLRFEEAEAKIAHLEEEVAAVKAKARKDAESDKARLLENADTEALRLGEKTDQEIVLRGDAADEGLRRFAADRVADLAAEEIKKRLDEDMLEKIFDRSLKTAREVFRA